MKRSENMTWAQTKVGIFIVAALLIFAAGVLLMGEKTKMFVPKGKLSLIMTDVAGISAAAVGTMFLVVRLWPRRR